MIYKLLKMLPPYIRYHRKSIILFFICVTTFAIILHLYKLPIDAILYAGLLCGVIYGIVGLYDFGRFYIKHKFLVNMQDRIPFEIGELPATNNLIEQDYTELIQIIHNDKISFISQNDKFKSDMIDYYTLWVHQIKTPISAMQLLLQETDSEENKELSTELFKVEQYVEMVLSYLRLGSQSTDFVIRNYELNEIIRSIVRKYAILFVRKKIKLDLKPIDCRVLTDEKWLSFAIEQILSNALKYTNKGTISIYMIENKTLVIEDSGIGISKEDLPRVCEKGFTGYNGRTDKKATGIGLYLCKTILNKLSHTIALDSKIGVGTKVMINLDIKEIDFY